MNKIVVLLALCSLTVVAQDAPRFEVDASWPRPLPVGWINGQVGGNCVDSHDHSVIVDRRNITEEEKETSMAKIKILDSAFQNILSPKLRRQLEKQGD